MGDAGSLPLQGPKGESVGSITQPLPSSYLIFRAASESDGEYLPALMVSMVTPPEAPLPLVGFRPGVWDPGSDPFTAIQGGSLVSGDEPAIHQPPLWSLSLPCGQKMNSSTVSPVAMRI